MYAGTTIAAFLLTLVAGTFLWVWVSKQEICCKKLANAVAAFVMVVSLLGVFCTAYKISKHCSEGSRSCPFSKSYCTKKDCDRKNCDKKHHDDTDATEDKSESEVMEEAKQ